MLKDSLWTPFLDYQPLLSLLDDEDREKSSPKKIKFKFGEVEGGSSGGEVVLVANREEEEKNFLVVRATINVDLEAPEEGVIRVSRERKWLLPAEQEGEEQRLEAEVEEQEHQEAKVMSLEDINQKMGSQKLEVNVLLDVRQQEESGEVTPPSSPIRRKGVGSKSPGAKAKSFARLTLFQQRLEEEFGLPPSRLKGEGRRLDSRVSREL